MANFKDREITTGQFGDIISETRDTVVNYLHIRYNVVLNEDEFLRLDDTLVDLLRTFFVVDWPDRTS